MCSHVEAQITVDGTTNTTLETTDNGISVNDGDRAGSNLFHSFSEFSIPDGSSATFNNAVEIENIFSRVTGGNISDINGAINANGGANLLLINPAGIVFGENASLNIGGSFFATSADSLLFEEGEFSAVNPQAAPILTINRPIGLNFGDNPGNITNRSTANDVGLQVSPQENISFVGGDLRIEGGLITAPGGRINLGGLSETGTVNITEDSSLSFPDDAVKANVFLSDNALVDIASTGGGAINVNANSLELTQKSIVQAGIGEGSGSEGAVGGTVVIDSTSISATDSSLIRADNNGVGRAGAIDITTETLDLASNAAITTSTFGVGDAGTIDINAQDITIDRDFAGIYSDVGTTYIPADEQNPEGVVGNGGIINIETGNLTLLDGARINSNSIAIGNAGTININATKKVLFQGVGSIPVPAFGGGSAISNASTQVRDEGVGDAGQINIIADSLSLIDVGAVLVDHSGLEGDAGNIVFEIENEVLLQRNALVLSQVLPGTTGNAGDINIEAGSLKLLDGSFVLSDNQGEGSAGNITVNVEENIVFESISEGFPSQFVAGLSRPSSRGTGGTIKINAKELSLSDAAFITSNSVPNSVGKAGDIIINVDRLSLQDNSLINTFTGNNDDGGSIIVNAQNINLTSGGKILAATEGGGDGGNINLNVTEEIAIDNSTESPAFIETPESSFLEEFQASAPTGIYANATPDSTGDSGSVIIGMVEGQIPQNFSLTNQGQIVVNSDGAGSGGNIFISSQNLQLENNAAISASTVFGRGGEVTLQIADNLLLRNNSLISARAFQEADGGNLSIDTDLIFASPNQNNDIIANAEQGTGGNIDLTAESILGIQERSSNPPNNTNDLDVSSDLSIDGTVTINNPDVDRTSGIIELSSVPINVDAILAQDLCRVENETVAGGSSFIVTGRGGLTPTSADSLGKIERVVNWADETDVEVSNNGAIAVKRSPETWNKNRSVIQSQGFTVATDGSLWLTANTNNNPMPQNSSNHSGCHT